MLVFQSHFKRITMKKLKYLVIAVFVLTNTTSCDKEFLEKQPLSEYSSESLWKDAGLIEAFVNEIYSGIHLEFSQVTFSSLVDESMYRLNNTDVNNSLITPSYLSSFTSPGMKKVSWQSLYLYIRSSNLLLENIDAAPITDEELKNQLKGEGLFLRAYFYSKLVSLYGGVPLVTKAYSLNDDFLAERNTYEDCIKFISEECDKAAALLPVVQARKGRATKGAALSLKSRVLLYAASDLANNTSWAGNSHPELVGYVGGNRQSRWEAAKAAAKAVIDLGAYELYKKDPAAGENTAQNYEEMFLSYETSEDIFVKYFTPLTTMDEYNPGLYATPNGWNGWGVYTPVGQMVDAYEMKDGSKFDWNDPTIAAAPYNNRDPRFYASINYNGAKWRKRSSDVIASDPVGVIQTGFYETWNSNTNSVQIIGGLDTQRGPLKDWNGTYTGYYMRKFIDPTVDAEFTKQDVPWRHFRYAEILLNYAEACIALGEDDEAKLYINMIRKRAGMPAITETGQDLNIRYRNERRIELAFEGHRFFDVRRWMIASAAYADAQSVYILYGIMPDKTTSPTPTSYSVKTVESREWNPKFYLLPITIEEINRNNKLIQNPLY